MSKTYKIGLLKKKSIQSPKIRIFEKIRTKIRTCTDKSVRVGTLVWHVDQAFCRVRALYYATPRVCVPFFSPSRSPSGTHCFPSLWLRSSEDFSTCAASA